MLSESFIASTLASSKVPASAALRDVGICVHELQPSPSLRFGFKRSSTPSNCLAVSATHVFAAQSEKAIVHVYSREKGNQEATVPFPERIRSIALAGIQNDGDVLVLGTEGGRLILWETCTGRRVSTTSSHLQPVTSLVVDPSFNFILSGSSDASIQVWSLVNLLSFSESFSSRSQQQPNSPIRVFSNHRAAITSLSVGHSAGRYNFAFSTSKDSTAIAWDYHTGQTLRTFLLPLVPLCATLDPADRVSYVGYEDGSVQMVDFYKGQSVQHPLYDPSLQSTPSQLSADNRWTPPSSDMGAVETVSLSYDGMTLLSGHKDGRVLSWNVARTKYASAVADYTHPVTNLFTLPPTGLPHKSLKSKKVTHTVVKPRSDFALTDPSNPAGAVPADYAFNTHIIGSASDLATIGDGEKSANKPDQFSRALTHASFPDSMIEEGLAELASLRLPGPNGIQTLSSQKDQNVEEKPPATVGTDSAQIKSLETENGELKRRASLNETTRRIATEEAVKLRSSLVNLQDYIDELHHKQDEAHRAKVLRQARKEDRDARRREAWFEAERRGRKGDKVLKAMEVEDSVVTSDTDEQSSNAD